MAHVICIEPIHVETHDPDGFTIPTDKPTMWSNFLGWFRASREGAREEAFHDPEAAQSRFRALCDPTKNASVYIMDETGEVTDMWNA